MSIKPDLGMRMVNDGISRNTVQHFYDFRLDHLSVLGRGRYTTIADMPCKGEMHAMSLDFTQEHLEQILDRAPAEIAKQVKAELSKDPLTARTIEFKGGVTISVRAGLGEIQQSLYENFVPLVVQEVL